MVTRIKLTDVQIAAFGALVNHRTALLAAADQIVEKFTAQHEQVDRDLKTLYFGLAEEHGIDLKTEFWNFEPETGDLVLKRKDF